MVATRKKRGPTSDQEPPLKKTKADGENDLVENPETAKDNAESGTVEAAKPTESLTSKSPKKKKKGATEDDMQWICGECKEAECMIRQDTSEFLICDGKCERVFHYPCAGLNELPPPDEDWVCKDCSKKRHQCTICQEYGNDDEEVFRCIKDRCGLFFHLSCLDVEGVEVKMVSREEPNTSRSATPSTVATSDDGSNSNDEETEGAAVSTLKPVFTCPAHNCWTCTQKDMIEKERLQAEADRKESANASNGKKKKGKRKKKKFSTIFQQKTETRLYRCLYCPTSYHLTCLPPTSRFHELAVLCHDHAATHKLPDLDLSSSLQNQVENRIDKKEEQLSGLRRRRLSGLAGGKNPNPFFIGIRGDKYTKDEEEYLQYAEEKHDMPRPNYGIDFCLPCDIKKEVESKPPTYKHLSALKYQQDHKPKKAPLDGERCQCVDKCAENCFNRLALEECMGDGPNSNCNVGGNCGNRSLGKREFVKCKPQREGGKGWGLVVVNAVPKGQLIQEYLGEVIDEEEKTKRLIEWNKEHPNDPNFYVMAISHDWYVDAREYANMARFINHSCDPNCKVVTVNVKGYKRNGIYAIKDIAAGEFLCYDYKFDTNQADRFICRCGAKSCRGTMQFGKQDKDKALSWKEAKAKYEMDKKFVEEREKKMAVSLVDEMVPGSKEQKDEYVSYGPPEHKRAIVLQDRVFLWRNAKRGADFASRDARLQKRDKSP